MDAAELKHMLTFKQSYRSASKRRERGSFLVESLIAMVVLAVGLGRTLYPPHCIALHQSPVEPGHNVHDGSRACARAD